MIRSGPTSYSSNGSRVKVFETRIPGCRTGGKATTTTRLQLGGKNQLLLEILRCILRHRKNDFLPVDGWIQRKIMLMVQFHNWSHYVTYETKSKPCQTILSRLFVVNRLSHSDIDSSCIFKLEKRIHLFPYMSHCKSKVTHKFIYVFYV